METLLKVIYWVVDQVVAVVAWSFRGLETA